MGKAKSRTHVVQLSSRELEVCKLVVEGLTNKEIAARLTIANSTVGHHIGHLFLKARVDKRTKLVAWFLVSYEGSL